MLDPIRNPQSAFRTRAGLRTTHGNPKVSAMKPLLRIATLTMLAVATVGLVGCSSLEGRIKEKSELFARLSPPEQQLIRQGYITQGFTPEMVYIALDKPEKVIPGPAHNEETWVYHNFYATDGSSLTPAQKVVTKASGSVRGGSGNTFTVEPDLSAENIKVESQIKVYVKFVDGKVTSINIVGR